jgi:hypothetical protein
VQPYPMLGLGALENFTLNGVLGVVLEVLVSVRRASQFY